MEWIPYVEIRDSVTRKILGLVEGAEIFFEYNWNGCGSCEIYCRATENNINLLKQGRYITIPNEIDYSYEVNYIDVDDVRYYVGGTILYTSYSNGGYSGGVDFEYQVDTGTVTINNVAYPVHMFVDRYCNIWRINSIDKSNDTVGGRFLTAKGMEAKCIVGNRIIRYMAVLSGDLISSIRDNLFVPNIINPADPNRQIPELVFNQPNFEMTIVDEEGNPTETQVTYDNLLEYTEGLYGAYNIGAKMRLNLTDLKLYYTIYQGVDKTGDMVFSRANENILNTNYSDDWTNYKTYVLVGGEDTEIVTQRDENGNATATIKGARKVNSIDDGSKGVDRYEGFVDAKDISSKYEDSAGVEQTMTDVEYKALLKSKGKEMLATEFSKATTFEGEIDTTNKRYKFNENYYLGDLVLIRDSDFGINQKVQIIKFTRVQNNEGYKEYFEHQIKEV